MDVSCEFQSLATSRIRWRAIDRRLRFGALVPWANVAMEAELPYILARNATWHFSRLVPSMQTTAIDDDFLTGLVDAIPPALASLSRVDLDGIAFGCTSAGFSFPERTRSVLSQPSGCKAVLSAYQAIHRVLEFLDARRIVLITPYEPDVTLREVRALTSDGFEVLSTRSLGLQDGIGNVSPETLFSLCHDGWHADADAVVISCTALHTLDVIRECERMFQKPTISSNLSLALALVLQTQTTSNTSDIQIKL